VAHVDERFAAAEFDLAAIAPKTRAIDWNAYAAEKRGGASSAPSPSSWIEPIKGALAYYLNRHTGPTGQVELNVPGLNIVVGSILPPGYSAHSDTTLTVAALAAIMAVTKEWSTIPLTEFAGWCAEAQAWIRGRRSVLGPVIFGMPGELVHAYPAPPRPKTRALPHDHCFVLAHTGSPDMGNASIGAYRAATTQIGMGLLQKRLAAHVGAATRPRELLLNDARMLELLCEIPQSMTRDAALAAGLSDAFVADLRKRFAAHPNPEQGYHVREKLLFVLAEMERAARAADALRGADAARIAAFMNIGQLGEASVHHRLSAGGRIEDTFPILHASSNDELQSMAEHGDPLWRQSGCSAASNPEIDLLADVALNVPGVLAARWSGAQRIAILCKHDSVKLLNDALTGAYYAPRNLRAADFTTQVFPCRGVSIVED
jgi:galactokinase